MKKKCYHYLEKMGACPAAVEWAKDFNTLRECWENCERGEWALWYAQEIGVDRKILVTAMCDCAERVLHCVPDGEDRPRAAIEAARRWAAGAATEEESRAAADVAVRAAADAACAAADAVCAGHAAAAAAARAAARAASRAATDVASYSAAECAADAAGHAVCDVAARAAARAAESKWQARRVREIIAWDRSN